MMSFATTTLSVCPFSLSRLAPLLFTFSLAVVAAVQSPLAPSLRSRSAVNAAGAVELEQLSEGRMELSGATAGRFAVFAGGYTVGSGNDSAVVDILDTATWTWSTASLSTARGVMGSAGLTFPAKSVFTQEKTGNSEAAEREYGEGDPIAVFAGGKHVNGNFTDVVDIVRWTNRGHKRAASAGRKGENGTGVQGKASTGRDSSDVGASAALTPEWTTVRLSKARSMISVVASSDGAYIFFAGGEYGENEAHPTTSQCSDVVDVWDVQGWAWASFSPLKLSQARKKLASAAVGDLILFGGGYLSGVGSVATVDTYNVKTRTWLPVVNMSTTRFRLQAATVNMNGNPGALFISGQGCDWTCPSADLFVLSDASNESAPGTWQITQMIHGRYEFAAVSTAGVVVVAGGKQPRPKGINPNLVEVFEPSTGKWRNATTTLQRPRYFEAGAAALTSPYGGPAALFAGGNDGLNGTSVEVIPIKGL